MKMTFDKYFECPNASVQAVNYPHIDAETTTDWSFLPSGFTPSGKAAKNFWIKTRERGKSYFINTKPFTFDIETTNAPDDNSGIVCGFMYHWACTYAGYYITGRRWSSFINFYNAVVATSGCGVHDTTTRGKTSKVVYKLICCVHNFSFEWQFIKHRLDFTPDDFFAKDIHNVVYAGTVDCVRFLDTYSISGVSLKNLSKQANLPTKKADGDLDYSKPRNSMTPLINNEPLYVQNDVYVLDEYYQYLIGTYVTWGLSIPITMTQKLRHDVRQESKKYFVQPDGHIDTQSVDWLISLFPKSLDELSELYNFTFKGGYTHANVLHVGTTLYNVYGIDFTSSYPAVMLQSDHFPVSAFVRDTSYEGVNNEKILNTDLCVIAKVRFYGICQKLHVTTESKTKSYEWKEAERLSRNINETRSQLKIFKDLTGFREDNGRMVCAEVITYSVTELDMRCIDQFYECESFEVLEAKVAQRGRLPKYIRDEMIMPYVYKSTLKNVKGSEALYQNSKGTVNGAYGMTVEKPHYEEVMLDDGEVDSVDSRAIDETDEQYLNRLLHGNNWEKVLKYQSAPTKVLSPYWGVYITAIARYRLLCGFEDDSLKGAVITMGDDTVYCDTDSTYFLNHERYMEWVEQWNARAKQLNVTWVDEYNRRNTDNPIDLKIFESLGGFDPISENTKDGVFSHFKTLGAKRYLKIDGDELVPTVAGCPKKSIISAVKDMTIEEKFDFFQNGMNISACKKGHVYTEHEVVATIEDEFGNVEVMHEYATIGITSIDFNMSMSDDFVALVENILESEGVNYE